MNESIGKISKFLMFRERYFISGLTQIDAHIPTSTVHVLFCQCVSYGLIDSKYRQNV